MRFRLMTREELLELYRDDQEICHRIARKESFKASFGTPYFGTNMYRHLGERINIWEDDDTFTECPYFKGFYWSKERLIPIDSEIVDIDKDMALKLI